MNLHPKHDDPEFPTSPQDAKNDDERPAHVIEMGPNHRRGITSTLVHLDESICRIEQMVHTESTCSQFYVERNALTESQKENVLSEVAAVRRILAELRQTLNLIPVTRDVGAAVSGRCMLLWESILELQGRYLKRFGEPSEELVKFLDPKTDEIVHHLDRIVRILGVFRLSGPLSSDKS